MDGDLSLSKSHGGLRIANPDHVSPHVSPSSLTEEANQLEPTVSPLSIAESLSTTVIVNSPPSLLPRLDTDASNPSSCQMDFDPSSFSPDALPVEKQPLSSPKQSSYSQRPANRQLIPLTYQDQQQAQFPQYPTMMPQNQRHPSSATRPASMLPLQPPRGSSNAIQPIKEGTYRVRTESSRSSIQGMPHRTSSRGASMALQAGVPTREGSHSDRLYRHSQQVHTGNGPLPPRKSSWGMGVGQMGSSVASNPPLFSASGLPYGLEGGPLASSDEWQDRGAAIGVRQETDTNGNQVSRYVKKGVKDFHFGRTLGEGSYSTVLAATDRQTLKEYAIKVLDKRHIIKEKKVKYVNIEKDTLNRLTDHPGVVRLYYTFQDQRSLYFVLDLASGGELLGVLKRMKTFDEECTRFYGAQILDTIDYMHTRGVIHRDLKPENVLLDDHMHVKITDFGTAKILDINEGRPEDTKTSNVPGSGNPMDRSEETRANSFVGTAEYVSPELLTDKHACKASDLWAFGCIIYQLLAGRPPFKAGNEYQTFQKIVALEYEFPNGFPDVAKDLVERLLVLDPSHRLTIGHIKNHEFFDGIPWGRGLWKQKAPRLKSYVPPTSDPISLDGHTANNGNGASYPPNIAPSHSTRDVQISGAHTSNSTTRPLPRVITELPPPSQLDIEWSPVLTRNNERILKLGNLLVLSMPAPHSPNSKNGSHNSEADTPRKFSRFFGSSTPKKRQRLVMVTSSARVIMAEPGGQEKKTKIEVPLLTAGCAWRKLQDPRGLTYWTIETRDKNFTFEDPKSASSDGSATSASAQEWLDTIDRAREIAISQSIANSYSGEDAYKDIQSGMSSPASTLDLDSPGRGDNGTGPSIRNTLQKHQSSTDVDSLKGRKRFSKRQSKSGLAAVF